MTQPTYLSLVALATLGIGSFSALGTSFQGATSGLAQSEATDLIHSSAPPRAVRQTRSTGPRLQIGSHSQAAGLGMVRQIVSKAVAEMIPVGEDAVKVARTRKAVEEVLISGYEALPQNKQTSLQGFVRKKMGNNQAIMRETFLTLGPGYQKLAQILSSRGDILSVDARATMASFTDSLPQYYGVGSRYNGTPQFHVLERMHIGIDEPGTGWVRRVRKGMKFEEQAAEPVMTKGYADSLMAHFEAVDEAGVYANPTRILPQVIALRSAPHEAPSLLGTGSVAEAFLIHGVDGPDLATVGHPVFTSDELVTKLTKQNIAPELEQNIASMMRGLDRAEPEARQALEPMLEDIRFMATRETDLRYEARAMIRARDIFRDPNAQVPTVVYGIDDLVLMKRAPGGNILDNLPSDPAARAALANDIGADVFEMLEDGFFHGDLHAGNILYDGKTRTYLDWGLYVELDTNTRKSLASLFQAARSRDEGAALDALRTLDSGTNKVGDADLMAAIRQTFERSEQDMQALQGLVGNARLAGLDLPPGVGLAAKSLYQIDGVLRTINPAFDYADAGKVFAKRLAKDATRNPVESYRRIKDLMGMAGVDRSDVMAAIAQSAPVQNVVDGAKGVADRVSAWRARRRTQD